MCSSCFLWEGVDKYPRTVAEPQRTGDKPLKSNLNRLENVCSILTRPGKFHCSARRFARLWGLAKSQSRAKFASDHEPATSRSATVNKRQPSRYSQKILILRRRKDLASCQRTRRGPRPCRITNRTEQNRASASPFSPADLSIECLASRYCCHRRTVQGMIICASALGPQ
jgi:hypothetical protein